ncbi:MAG TPA: hypothetical protein DCQ94_08335 [Nitrospira sp.]|nr:hypothetical protein [Nitrospira sp.]
MTRVVIWYIVVSGLAGCLLLVLIGYILSSILPPCPDHLLNRRRDVRKRTEEGADGDSDIYSLDSAVADAEMSRPGSTLWLYLLNNAGQLRLSFRTGCVLFSFGVTAKVIQMFFVFPAEELGMHEMLNLDWLYLVGGAILLLQPVLAWIVSRPFRIR